MPADLRDDATSIRLPDPGRRIGARSNDPAPVGTKRGAHDGPEVAAQLGQRLAGARVPYPRRAVVAGRDNTVASRAEDGPGYYPAVPAQLGDALSGADVPDTGSEIPTRDEQP